MPYDNVERMLCDRRFGDLHEARMSPAEAATDVSERHSGLWERILNALPNGFSKPEVAARMTGGQTAVRTELSSILNQAAALARTCRCPNSNP